MCYGPIQTGVAGFLHRVHYDAGQNKLLIVGGYQAGAAMIQIEKSGDKYNVKELYKTQDFGEHTKPPFIP